MKNNILNVVFKHLIFKFSLKQEQIKMEMVVEDILCKILCLWHCDSEIQWLCYRIITVSYHIDVYGGDSTVFPGIRQIRSYLSVWTAGQGVSMIPTVSR